MPDHPASYTPSQRAILASQLDEADHLAPTWPEPALRTAEAYWRWQCRTLLAQVAALAERASPPASPPPPGMSDSEWRHLTRLLVDASGNASTEWEENFVTDMEERVEKYGRRIELTKDQWAKLEEIAEGQRAYRP